MTYDLQIPLPTNVYCYNVLIVLDIYLLFKLYLLFLKVKKRVKFNLIHCIHFKGLFIP